MNILPDTVQAIQKLIQKAQSVLVVSHLTPDGDAIGSLLGMGLALQQMGKVVTLACEDPSPEIFSYLMGMREIQLPPIQGKFDLLVSVDCGDEERMGRVYRTLPALPPAILNIDHHVTNTRFGTINLVQPSATSTAEMLYQLFVQLGVLISPEIADCLLTGVVTDTQGFRIAGVTPQTIRVASKLMEAGADLASITMRALNLRPLATLKIYQHGLANMKFQGGFLWTTISYAEQQEANYHETGSSGLVSMFGNTAEAAMGAVLMELADGRVVVSFRCRPPWNVSDLATGLGGGGHPFASGCTLAGPLAAAEQLVMEQAIAEIERQRMIGTR